MVITFCQGLKKSDSVLNINTCYECTHGLTEEETYHIHGCTSNLTVKYEIDISGKARWRVPALIWS